MDPLLGGLITGGASLLGNIFSSTTSAAQSAQNTAMQIGAQQGMLQETERFNAGQVQQQDQFQASQAAAQRAFEQQMSNTAYQRASADMKKAGLNPMAMFGGGSAASTPSVASPSGASASVGTPSVPMPQNTSPWSGIGDAVGKAVSSAVASEQFNKMTQEIANLRTQNALTAAQAKTEEYKPMLTRDLAEQARASADLTATNREAAVRRMPAATLEGTKAQDVLNMPAYLRETLDAASYAGRQVHDAISPLGVITNTARGIEQLL